MSNSDKSSRPVLRIERSPLVTILDVVAIVGIVVSLIMIISSWQTIPERIPMHFNAAGKVTSYGSKNTLGIFPLNSIFSYFLLKILSRYPHTFNYPVTITAENAPTQYRLAIGMMYWLVTEIIWLFALIQWQIIQAATSPNYLFNPLWIMLPMLGIFVTIGIYFGKAFQVR